MDEENQRGIEFGSSVELTGTTKSCDHGQRIDRAVMWPSTDAAAGRYAILDRIESFWNKIKKQMPSSVWEHYQRYRRTLYVLGTPAKSYEKQQACSRPSTAPFKSIDV